MPDETSQATNTDVKVPKGPTHGVFGSPILKPNPAPVAKPVAAPETDKVPGAPFGDKPEPVGPPAPVAPTPQFPGPVAGKE